MKRWGEGMKRGLEDNGRNDRNGWNRMDMEGKERNEKDVLEWSEVVQK